MTETFEAEDTNSIDVQQGGWLAILDNFKKYTREVRDNCQASSPQAGMPSTCTNLSSSI